MAIDKPLRVAVIVNSGEFFLLEVKESFTAAFAATSTPVTIDWYDPIVDQVYPYVRSYDLIILSGGTADLTKDIPWVLKLEEWIRNTVSEFPEKKFLGLCWGHQVVAAAFGGDIALMEEGEVGVHTIPLTKAGSLFFKGSLPSSTSFNVMEFHGREIQTPAKGFIALAEQNQAFVNEADTILTFQGHPEIGTEFAKKILDNKPGYISTNNHSANELIEKIGKKSDGMAIWKRILFWVEGSSQGL